MKRFLIEFDIDSTNIIMLQLKSIKQHIYYKNEQLHSMQDKYDNNSVFSTTLPPLRSNETTIWIF